MTLNEKLPDTFNTITLTRSLWPRKNIHSTPLSVPITSFKTHLKVKSKVSVDLVIGSTWLFTSNPLSVISSKIQSGLKMAQEENVPKGLVLDFHHPENCLELDYPSLQRQALESLSRCLVPNLLSSCSSDGN